MRLRYRNLALSNVPVLAPPLRDRLQPEARFRLTHLALPLGLLAVLITQVNLGGWDGEWADRLYAWQGHHWAWRDAFLTETVAHRVGHDLSVLGWCAALVAWIVAMRREALRMWRRPLAYLLLSVLVATSLVGFIKHWSNMDCPWDLTRYGGTRPFIGLLGTRPVGLARGICFPAGHASSGYAWMSLYFFLAVVRPRWRWIGLGVGLGSGALFGISQQLRGAHFLSHDLWTLMICWAVAALLFKAMWPAAILYRGTTADSTGARV